MEKNKKIEKFIYIFILSVVYYFMLPISIYKGLPMGDTPIFEYFGYAMTRDKLMYVDLFDHKGPIIFIIHYFGWSIYGEMGIKILFSTFVFFFLYFSYKIVRIFTKGYEYILIIFIEFLCFIYLSERGLNVETLALPFITMALYFYIDYFENGNFTFLRGIVLGISCSVVFFTRVNMIGLWLLMTIIFIIYNIINKDGSMIFSYIVSFSIGGILILILLLIYFLLTGALMDMLYQAFYVNFKYSTGEGIGKRKVLEWALYTLNALTLLFFFLVGNILKKTDRRLIIYGIVVIVLIGLSLISKRSYWHYLIVIVPLFLPYIVIVIKEIFSRDFGIYKIFVLLISIWIFYSPLLSYLQENIRNRDNYDVNLDFVSKYIKDNSMYDEKIYSHKLTGAVYLGAERLASTKYFFIPSIPEELFIDDYKKDFEIEKPKYIVLDYTYIGSSNVDLFIKNLVENEYSKEVTYSSYEIYRLKT